MNKFLIFSCLISLAACAGKPVADSSAAASCEAGPRGPAGSGVFCSAAVVKPTLPNTQVHARISAGDPSRGEGLRWATIFSADSVVPLESPDESPVTLGRNLISFYQSRASALAEIPDRGPTRIGERSRGRTAVMGIPTRIYVDAQGEPVYINFDAQAVALLVASTSSPAYRVIDGQGPKRHLEGFGSPLGRLKKLPKPISAYGIEDLRKRLGKEGTKVKLEYESGVIIEGVVEKYTMNNFGYGWTPIVISLKAGTVTAQYGVHSLFQPEWGSFDLLVMDQIENSSVRQPTIEGL